MKPALRLAGLFAGLLLFNLLLNLPGFTREAPVASLLAPSIDLLVVSALLAFAAQSRPTGRRALRALAVALLLLFTVYEAATRFGTDAVFRPLPLLAVPAGAAAGWLAAGLVLRGFDAALVRSAYVAAVAVTAVVQVMTANKVLTQSIVPRMARDAAAACRGLMLDVLG